MRRDKLHYALMSDESDRLRRARARAGFASAADAARRLNLHYPTYAAHENGSRGFSKQSARRYATAFKINVQWLLYGLGDPTGKSIEQTILALPDEYRRQVVEYIDYIKAKAS
jgi:DNA-binding XRE family transcriptional regulator